MKNALFATTALAAMAVGGMASAQGISLFGNARLGLFYDEGRDTDDDLFTDDNELFAISRVRFGVNMTGTTNSGITFGGTIRADNSAGGASFQQTAGETFVSGAFGTLTYGDTDGADRFRTGDVTGVGLTTIRDFNETPHLTNARGGLADLRQSGVINPALPDLRTLYGVDGVRPTVRYDFDLFGFGASVSTDGNLGDIAAGIGYESEFGAIGVEAGVGYARLDTDGTGSGAPGEDDIDQWSAALGGSFGDYGAKVTYTRIEEEADFSTIGLGVTAGFGDFGVQAFAQHLLDDADEIDEFFEEDTLFGLGGSYDLGGGASVRGGLVRSFQDDIVADFGILMTF